MKNHYQELRDRQQEEVNAFPMFFRSINGSSQRECAGSACALPT